MTDKININIPINKTYFNTFLNSFISIHFYNDQSHNLESLRGLLFPPEHPDREFNDMVNFIKVVFDEMIKMNKDEEVLQNELKINVIYI